MEPETVLDLFDSFWFSLNIVQKQPPSPPSNPNPQIQASKPNISSQLSIHSMSKSDNTLFLSTSPDSVLKPRHLQSVISEGEISLGIPKPPIINKKKRFSKSLSELEFEEVKGFMDLGFVFSEEDLDSSLVEIIPGLQRLGQETVAGHHREERRPYLSEAWEFSNEVRPLMKWKVPDVSNEVDMKDSLKWWAHTVASAVR